MLPKSMRGGFKMSPQDELMVVDVGGDEITLYRAAGASLDELARLPRGGAQPDQAAEHFTALVDRHPNRAARHRRIVLRIPDEQILSCKVELPSAAMENLREVLSFEMHRFTPFEAKDVHFEFRLLSQPTQTAALQVGVDVFRRDGLDQVLQMLAPLGLELGSRVDLRALGFAGFFLVLERPQQPRPMRVAMTRILWAANAALLIALLVIPLLRQETQLAELRAQVAKTRIEAQAAIALRQRLEALIADRQLLNGRKRLTPSGIEVLSALSAALPDSTWLRRFKLKQGKVSIEGSSSASSALIGLIEQAAIFREVSFQSPVVRASTSGEERFKLAFSVAPRGNNDEHQSRNIAKQSVSATARGARRHGTL
jgi:general secretion pathway protein L